MFSETILVICDDADIRAELRAALRGAGYVLVRDTDNGDEGLKLVREMRPSIVILDVVQPGLDGFTVCRRIRETPEISDTPVIMLSAKGEDRDIVRGLDLGADDYVTKPFSWQVLIARIQAVLRRPEAMRHEGLSHDGLVFDAGAHAISLQGVSIELTSSEWRVLSLLMSRPGRVYTRKQIIEVTQRPEKAVTERAIDVQMVGLRRKLGKWAAHIETIRGVGYRFRP